MTRLGTSLPLARGSFPVRYLVDLHLLGSLANGCFRSNPGQEPFGARFWQFGGFRTAIKTAFWDYWETAVCGKILAGSLLEPDFSNLEASRPAIKSAFWDYWETAVFGQIVARSLLEPNFCNLAASGLQLKTPSGTIGKRPVFEPNPGRELFGARFWQFAGFPAASKHAFWNYWETAVFGQILAGSLLDPDFAT